MAFRKKNINEIFRTVLVLSALLSTASAVDCFGKSFHCVNSTHFMICVDLGGGVSQSIDDFLIPCPPPTVCQGSNHFECEYPAVTTLSTTLSNVISDTTEPWEEIVVTTNTPSKNMSTTKEYSEKYMNTISITSVAEDNLTTDTTIDATTEAFSLSDVNSNSNVIEIIPVSPQYEVTTRVEGITQTVSDNISGAAEVTTALLQIIPLNQTQNVTNETIVDNGMSTFPNTEPTVTLKNNNIFVENDSVREVSNITTTSQSDNIAGRTIIGDIITTNKSMIDISPRTDQPLTSITDESFVTGVNLVVTTTQTLVSSSELQKSGNMNGQTTSAEPGLTLGKEQFEITGFEENFTTESVKNSDKEQSNVLTPEVVQNEPAQLPIPTYQLAGTTVTNMDVNNEVIVETTIVSEQSTATMYKVNLSTTNPDFYITEAPLTISTAGKTDTLNTRKSDKVLTKLTDDSIVYQGIEQSATDINSLRTNIDVTTEQPTAITTEIQKLRFTEQIQISKDITVTEPDRNLINTSTESPKLSDHRLATNPDIIIEKSSDLAMETQQKQENEQIKNTKYTTNSGNENAAGARVLPPITISTAGKIDTQNSSKSDDLPTKLTDDAIVYRGNEQSTTDLNILPTISDVTIEQPTAITRETQKVFAKEKLKINKEISVAEQVLNLINTGTEAPKRSDTRLATDPDIITEKPRDSAKETQQKEGSEQIIITKNTTTTGNDVTIGVSILPVEAKKTIDEGVQQSKDNTQSLIIVNDAFTESPSEYTATMQKLPITEVPKINKNNSAIENVQKLDDSIIESPKSGEKSIDTDFDIVTDKFGDLATVTQQKQGNEQIITHTNITTAGNVAAEVTILPKGEKQIEKGIQQSEFSIQSSSTANDTITENLSKFATETPKEVRATPLIINKNSSTTRNDMLTETSVAPLEAQTPTHNVGQRKIGLNSSPTENTIVFATVTQQSVYLSMDVATNRNDLLTTVKHEPTKEITGEEKAIIMGAETTTTNNNDLLFDNYAIVSKTSEITTEAQQLNDTGAEIQITSTTTAIDTIAENSVLNIETQKPTYMSTPQPITKVTDTDVNVQKANVFTAVTPKFISMNTEQPITIKKDLVTDINVTTDTIINSVTGTSMPTIQIQEEVALRLIDYNNKKEKHEDLVTDNTSFAVLTTESVAVQSADVTEQPIITELVNSIVPNATISSINTFHNNMSSNTKLTGTIVVQSRNTTTATTTESTTIKTADDKMKEENTAFTSSVKASDSDRFHTIERVNLISAENIADQLSMTETSATESGAISTLHLNPVLESNDFNSRKVSKNQSKNTNTVHAVQLSGAAEATSETTATENFTPSLNPDSESSQKNTNLTSNNQVTTEIANIAKDNLTEEASSFVTAMASNILLKENGNIFKTLTTLNTQDNSYVSFTTEASVSLHDNIANKIIPKLTTLSENQVHETSSVYHLNNDVNYSTSTTRVIENTGTAFAEESTTLVGTAYESRVFTKNGTNQHAEINTQILSTRQPMQATDSNKNEYTNKLISNSLSNNLLDKINEAVTESSTSFQIKNDGNINNLINYSTVTDNGSTQLPQIQIANGVTSQASIPIVRTHDNLPLSSLNSLSAAGAPQKTKYPANTANTENLSTIQPETSLKETSINEDLFLKGGNVKTSYAVSKADTTKGFSVYEGVKNVHETTINYFSTPSEKSTLRAFDEKGLGDFNLNLPPEDLSTKTTSSMYNTESKEYYESRVSKFSPVLTVENLQTPVINSNDSKKTTKIEITTEASKNKIEGSIILNKIQISTALPVPVYKTDMHMSDINKSIPITSHGTKTSETKPLPGPYDSVTHSPIKHVTSAMNNNNYFTEKSDTRSSSKSSGGAVNVYPKAIESTQQTDYSFKTAAESISGQSNETNVIKSNEPQYNSSFKHSTELKSSNNTSNAAKNQSSVKSQFNSTIDKSQLAVKVVLAKNSNKDVKSEAKDNMLQNNSSYGQFIITAASSNNVSQGINKNGSPLSQKATNTTKFDTQGELESPLKTKTNSTRHNPVQVEPISTRPNKMYSVITTLQVPIKKITPRPVVTIRTTKKPSKQIPKTSLANFSCINGVRGRYSDKGDCRKFYICIGISQPIIGNCPANTVFSDFSKLCTKNLSHCVRQNEFKCPSAGRFSDIIIDNVYYVCVSHKNHLYRFKFQCQKGFMLNKTTIRCEEIKSNQPVSISMSENSNDGSIKSSSSSSSSSASRSGSSSMSTRSDISSSSSSMTTSSDSSSSSSSSSSNDSSNGDSNSKSNSSKDNSSSNSGSSSSKVKENKESKEKPEGKEGDDEEEVFECEKEGKFPVRNDCKRYYLCKKNGKSEFRRKIKKCESGEVFHKGKKNNKNNSENSESESDDDRRPSNRRQRKEKKERPKSKQDEDDEQDENKYEREDNFPASDDCKEKNKESKDKPEGKDDDEEDQVFECEKEGRFPIRHDCKRYYLCKKNRKSEYRRKIKKCDSDEVFHKSKKKCVDADSYEC